MNKEIQYGYDTIKTSYVSYSTKGHKPLPFEESKKEIKKLLSYEKKLINELKKIQKTKMEILLMLTDYRK